MRIEQTILEGGCQQVRFHCSDGEVITRRYEGLENHLSFILSERKMNELSAIIIQAGGVLEDNAAINFYEALNRRILAPHFDALLNEHIANQAALRALMSAYVDLGGNGQRTLLLQYIERSGLRHGQPPFFPNPDTFMQTIESLLSGPATGGGRRRDDIAQTKLSVIDLAWNLFEELGVETSVNDTGSLTLFVRAIFSDPGLSFLGGMPVDMRPLLREVRDSRPSQPNTGGANSLNYHPC